VTPMKQKTITKSVRTMIRFDTVARVRGKKSGKRGLVNVKGAAGVFHASRIDNFQRGSG
jgi:hypothetical protein